MKFFATKINRLTAIVLSFFPICTFAQQPFSIGVTDSVQSAILGETRAVNIYLPQGYSKDSLHKYPVIYLLDGSADEDFIHVSGLVQFFNFPWINRFPESIVVGISNTNRQRDFTFPVDNLDFVKDIGFDPARFKEYGGSGNFIQFIEKELQPFIEKNYSSNPNKTLIGQSLGGLLASEIAIKHTKLFDTYVIISPSLWWDRASLLNNPKSSLKTVPAKVYVAVGKEGKIMEDGAKKLSATLKKMGLQTVLFEYFENEDHATIGHIALYNAFLKLYPAATTK